MSGAFTKNMGWLVKWTVALPNTRVDWWNEQWLYQIQGLTDEINGGFTKYMGWLVKRMVALPNTWVDWWNERCLYQKHGLTGEMNDGFTKYKGWLVKWTVALPNTRVDWWNERWLYQKHGSTGEMNGGLDQIQGLTGEMSGGLPNTWVDWWSERWLWAIFPMDNSEGTFRFKKYADEFSGNKGAERNKWFVIVKDPNFCFLLLGFWSMYSNHSCFCFVSITIVYFYVCIYVCCLYVSISRSSYSDINQQINYAYNSATLSGWKLVLFV